MNANQKHFAFLAALALAMAWACSAANAQALTNPQPPVVTNFVVVVTNVVVTNVVVTNIVVTNIVVTNAVATNSVITVTNAVLTNSLALNPMVKVVPEWGLETWKIFFDKFILALVFLGAGCWASKRLENHKSSLIFTTELNKTRLEKLATVWSNLYDYKKIVIEALECVRGTDLTQNTYPSEMNGLLDRADAVNKEAEKAIQVNSFWLGRQQTETWKSTGRKSKNVGLAFRNSNRLSISRRKSKC